MIGYYRVNRERGLNVEQPTKEQIEQFWQKCGLTKDIHYWYTQDWKRIPDDPFLFNLNNIFKYAIPKLQNEGYETDIVCYEQKSFRVRVMDAIHLDGKVGVCEDDDLSLALFGAIWEVIK